jgi:hypothetical protein
MLKDSKSWMCGTTNSIVTQQKEIDIFVNVRCFSVNFLSSFLPLVTFHFFRFHLRSTSFLPLCSFLDNWDGPN